jgi:protein-tyrosine phosphatase
LSYPLGVETNSRAIPGTSGRHWRSAAPDELDEDGWATLLDAEITTVVDLRNDSEVPIRRTHPGGVTVVRAPLEDVDDPEYIQLWENNWAHPDFYLWGIRHWPTLWEAALSALADAPSGVLVHCAGGRDRTGLLVAVLLDRAGVERGRVLDDYEAGLRGVNAMLVARGLEGHAAEVPADRLEEFVRLYREALDRVLDEMPTAIEDAGLASIADRAARALIRP